MFLGLRPDLFIDAIIVHVSLIRYLFLEFLAYYPQNLGTSMMGFKDPLKDYIPGPQSSPGYTSTGVCTPPGLTPSPHESTGSSDNNTA
jgi:hypothetical protein